MRIHFKDKCGDWQCYSVLTVGGEGSAKNVVASIAITNKGRGTRVDVLSSAGDSCFQELRYVDGVAYISFGEYVDAKSHRVARYHLDGYFGHMHDMVDIVGLDMKFLLLVTSASEVLALSRIGELLWPQSHLGIDGVVLYSANTGQINDTGEWDPSGEWRKFALLADSGAVI